MPSPASQAVFLSYASQDAAAAHRICESLRSAGIEVWFDQNELVGGDAWDAKIRKQIASCVLFVPIISAQTQSRLEGYFRLEWKIAAQRTHTMADEKTFLLPVVIDATRDADAKVPAEFKAVQWTRLPGGETSAAFVARVQQLLGGGAIDVGRGSDPPSDDAPRERAGHRPALPRHRVPATAWAVGLAAIVALAALALWQPWRPASQSVAKSTPPSAPPAPNGPPSAAPRLGSKSIAVLPFENLSEDRAANASFTDGMHDDVITSLLLLRDVRCVPRATAMTYRDTKKTPREIAEELGVALLLNGTVRRGDGKVRIIATLLNPRTDETLWIKPYEKNATDVFSIQSELAQAIAGELKATLSPEEKKLVARRPTENPTAYDLFIQARENRNLGGAGANVNKQLEQLEAAVKLDPNFAWAWADLAWVQSRFVQANYDHATERLAAARLAIDTAVRLAPDDPEVILNLGHYHSLALNQHGIALEHFQRVARLQPNAPAPIYAIALTRCRQGRWAEALQGFSVVIQLDPASPYMATQYGQLLNATRRWDAWFEERRRFLRLAGRENDAADLADFMFRSRGSLREAEDPANKVSRPTLRRWRGENAGLAAAVKPRALDVREAARQVPYFIADATCLAAVGEREKARAHLAELPAALRTRLQAEPDNALVWSRLAMVEAVMGNKDEALRCGRKAITLLPESLDAVDGAMRRADYAFALAWAGEKDAAISEYAHLLVVPIWESSNLINVHVMRHHSNFFPLQGDPRFEALLNDPKNNAPLF